MNINRRDVVQAVRKELALYVPRCGHGIDACCEKLSKPSDMR